MNLLTLHALEWPGHCEITKELRQELAAMLTRNPFKEEDEEEFHKLGI